MKPISSQSSMSSSAGMLCDVRMASHPMSLSIVSCLRIAALLMAAPSGPRSWWRQTPRNLRGLPLRKNPLSGMISMVLKPNLVLTLSHGTVPSAIEISGLSIFQSVFTEPPAYTSVSTKYMTGLSGDHNVGFSTVSVCSISPKWRSLVSVTHATACPSGSRILVFNVTAEPFSTPSIFVRTLTTA